MLECTWKMLKHWKWSDAMHWSIYKENSAVNRISTLIYIVCIQCFIRWNLESRIELKCKQCIGQYAVKVSRGKLTIKNFSCSMFLGEIFFTNSSTYLKSNKCSQKSKAIRISELHSNCRSNHEWKKNDIARFACIGSGWGK